MFSYVILRPLEQAVRTLNFFIVKSKELGVKGLFYKLKVSKHSEEARHLTRIIHDLGFTIHNLSDKRGSTRSLRRLNEETVPLDSAKQSKIATRPAAARNDEEAASLRMTLTGCFRTNRSG